VISQERMADEHADEYMTMRSGRVVAVYSHADPDGANAQIDLIGVPWPKVSEEPSAVQNGGSLRGLQKLG
jgi:hypothetical protein